MTGGSQITYHLQVVVSEFQIKGNYQILLFPRLREKSSFCGF